MSTNITSGAWWKDALVRALRTAVLIAVPYVGGSLLSAVPWLTIASAAGLGFVASLITSLAGLPDANSQPWWLATLTRVTKTVAQSLAAGIVTAVTFQDVNWPIVVQASAIAGLGSLLLAVLSELPEAVPPTQAVVVATVTGQVPVINNPSIRADYDSIPAVAPTQDNDRTEETVPVAPVVNTAPVAAPATPDIENTGEVK